MTPAGAQATHREAAAAQAGDRRLSLGVDLGGTKIEVIALDGTGQLHGKRRVPTPRHDYAKTITAIQNLCDELTAELIAAHVIAASAPPLSVGIGIPGNTSRVTGLIHNANSTWINGRDFHADLSKALNRRVALTNDANCFILSEATDGAAADAGVAFGVILGTGVGGGITVNGHLLHGAQGIAGEWGHNPLPWPQPEEAAAPPTCWCGRTGCMEAWVSGPAMIDDHCRDGAVRVSVEQLAQQADAGDAAAVQTFARHQDRLARGLAHVVNVIDPDVIVLGGGLSNLANLYTTLPDRVAGYVFADTPKIVIRPPRWGDASGARGAARLVM